MSGVHARSVLKQSALGTTIVMPEEEPWQSLVAENIDERDRTEPLLCTDMVVGVICVGLQTLIT
jgi:hypothetical protein